MIVTSQRSNHTTHCHIAQKPTAPAKTCQRVCLPQRCKTKTKNKELKHTIYGTLKVQISDRF